jgi:hypothetical protein
MALHHAIHQIAPFFLSTHTAAQHAASKPTRACRMPGVAACLPHSGTAGHCNRALRQRERGEGGAGGREGWGGVGWGDQRWNSGQWVSLFTSFAPPLPPGPSLTPVPRPPTWPVCVRVRLILRWSACTSTWAPKLAAALAACWAACHCPFMAETVHACGLGLACAWHDALARTCI